MVQVTAKIEGADALDGTLADLAREYGPRNTRNIFNTPLRKAMEPVFEAIKQNTPIDTGDLVESVKLRVGRPSKTRIRTSEAVDEFTVAEARAGWFWKRGDRVNSYQALAVEFGTLNTPAQPVLRRALQENSGTVVSTFSKELGENITRTARRLAKKRARGTLRR